MTENETPNQLDILRSYLGLLSRTEDWARFMEKALKDENFREQANERISQCMELVRNGLDLNEAQKKLSLGKKEASIIFELAHSRIDLRGKFQKWDRLWMDQYLSRYSTPEAVCLYRAERIHGFSVVEAGSGAGMQGIFLSQSNESTISVEVQPERHRMARLNAMEYKTGKIKFLQGDIYALSQEFQIDGNTLIFSDPARSPNEVKRTMGSLIPSPESLMRVFGGRTGNFVFDLPPQMGWDQITIDGEKEYLSIDGSLNRLTLYCGRLKAAETSAVMLPQGTRISGTPRDEPFPEASRLDEFILIPDISIVYAKLLWILEENYHVRPAWKDSRRRFYTSGEAVDGFPGEQFEILASSSREGLADAIKETGAGKVILRFSLPESQYYAVKKELEADLHGPGISYIFKKGDAYYIAQRIK